MWAAPNELNIMDVPSQYVYSRSPCTVLFAGEKMEWETVGTIGKPKISRPESWLEETSFRR
jgi:hypothetical protein